MADTRRGTVTDIPVILVTILGLTITVVVASLVLDTVIGATTNSMINQAVLQDAQAALQLYDYGIAFVMTGMFAVSALFAWRIQTSAINIVPAILFLGLSVWLSSEVANIYGLFANANSQISNVASGFGGVALLYSNLPVVVAAFGAVIIVALYVRRRQGPAGEVTA